MAEVLRTWSLPVLRKTHSVLSARRSLSEKVVLGSRRQGMSQGSRPPAHLRIILNHDT